VTGRLRRAVAARPALLGVVGAVLLLAGGSWYQAFVTPPYRFIDEQAHAGYVLELQHGRLPSIDTPIDAAAGGGALQERLAMEPERRRDVWVANNPPLTYLLAVGPSALTRALGVPGGPLVGLRLLNVAATAGAVVLAYLLARDLAGGDPTVGLVGAGIVAAMPHLGFVAALGFNDGTSLLATTAVALALARLAGAGPGPLDGVRAARWLGLAAAGAALCRPMALVYAGAAVLLGAAITWWRRQAPLPIAAAWLAGPTAVSAGWWYALSWARYGDPTGSDALFEKFDRQPGAPLPEILTTRGIWESNLRTIATRRLEAPLPGDPYLWYQLALWVLVVGVAGAAVLVVRSAVRHRGGRSAAPGRAPALPGTAWAASAALATVPLVLVAQHRAGGGTIHPRYLFPMLAPVSAAIALTTVRLLTRWAGAALVAVLALATWRQTRASADWLADHPTGPLGSVLVGPIGPDLLRVAGLVAAVAGLALLLAAIAVSTGGRGRPTTVAPS